jgi:hypothetical protein
MMDLMDYGRASPKDEPNYCSMEAGLAKGEGKEKLI